MPHAHPDRQHWRRGERPAGDVAVYTPVNEISFLAWAIAETHLIHPYKREIDARNRTGGASLLSLGANTR